MKDQIIKILVITLLSLLIILAVMTLLSVRINPHFFFYNDDRCKHQGPEWLRGIGCERPSLFIPLLK